VGGLGATYDDHLRLIRKPVVDFLLVLIELFSLGESGPNYFCHIIMWLILTKFVYCTEYILHVLNVFHIA